MVSSPAGDSVYVASALNFKDMQGGGVVYKLDPKTLKTIGEVHTDQENFGAVLSPDGKTLYVINSLDGDISALDTAIGNVKTRTLFKKRNKKGFLYGACEILLYDGLLYVGGVADPAVIWVVDTNTMKLKNVLITQENGSPGGIILNKLNACTLRTAAANP